MAGCAKKLTAVKGTAKGKNPVKVFYKAIAHLLLNGQQGCAGGTCDSGSCTFGLTSLSGDIEVVQSGENVQITVTGDGSCFCE
jgi:hypothetical protein